MINYRMKAVTAITILFLETNINILSSQDDQIMWKIIIVKIWTIMSFLLLPAKYHSVHYIKELDSISEAINHYGNSDN